MPKKKKKKKIWKHSQFEWIEVIAPGEADEEWIVSCKIET